MAPNYKDTLRTDKRTVSKNSHKNFNAHDIDGRMAEETFAIIHYVIFSSTGRPTNSSPSHVAVKFCKLVNDMLSKHEVFNCICANLDLSPSNITRDFNGVAESMFEDSRMNWGRLVALVAFSVKVAEHFRSQGYQSQEDIVVDLASNFIVYKAGPWIVDKGGWGDVVTHFADTESDTGLFSVRNDRWFKGILVTATATIGLGALFAVTCK